MSRDWLLIETVGREHEVVSQGRRPRKSVPLNVFLRRSPDRSAIVSGVAEAVRSGRSGVRSITGSDRVIRTEPVRMTDGHVHGVQVWVGPATMVPPSRPVIGAVVWDLTAGTASDTLEAVINAGLDPDAQPAQGRTFADDMPVDKLNPSETRLLAMTIRCKPGDTFDDTWELTDFHGRPITTSFTSRAVNEVADDGTVHLVCRAMNWRSISDRPAPAVGDDLAHRIVKGMARPGVHRALMDVGAWNLLKWLDPPCPHFEWRREESGRPFVHPDDRLVVESMKTQFTDAGVTEGVLRLRSPEGGWAPLHVTVYRIELDVDVHAGLLCIRLPTPVELNLTAKESLHGR